MDQGILRRHKTPKSAEAVVQDTKELGRKVLATHCNPIRVVSIADSGRIRPDVAPIRTHRVRPATRWLCERVRYQSVREGADGGYGRGVIAS